MTECKVPPLGWRCSRPSDHEGPCAAWPVEPTPDEILDEAWGSMWGPPEPAVIPEASLYWEVFPQAKERMGVHRAVGYLGPRPVAVVTARTGWGCAWKMMRADLRQRNRRSGGGRLQARP